MTRGGRLIPGNTEKAWRIPYFCSVDCSALPSETDAPYPGDGTLLFFVEHDYLEPVGRVLYVPEGVETVEAAPPEDDEDDDEGAVILPECDLHAFVAYDWPFWLDTESGDDPDPDPDVAEFHRRVPRAPALEGLAREVWPGVPYGEFTVGLGRYPYSPQHPPEFAIAEEQLEAEFRASPEQGVLPDGVAFDELASERGWRLIKSREWVTLGLFEIPDNESFYASFLIHKEDLAARRFDDVRFFVEH